MCNKQRSNLQILSKPKVALGVGQEWACQPHVFCKHCCPASLGLHCK